MTEHPSPRRWPRVLAVALRLGSTSFGGPIAHLGYFHDAYVARLGWLSEGEYADLVALCQVLPGPTSSQVGMAIGLKRAGLAGALAAWVGFTLPSFVLLVAFASGLRSWAGADGLAWLHGLRTAAVAVVAHALLAMARANASDARRGAIALASGALVLVVPTTAGQIGALLAAGAFGAAFLTRRDARVGDARPAQGSIRRASAFLGTFAVVLVGAFALPALIPGHGIDLFCSFFKAGSFVFGGGHVVLPLLQSAVVEPGWINADAFVAGYGAAQAVPGPLFSIAAYLGAAMAPAPSGWGGALLCTGAIFLPSFLLVCGLLPVWERWRRLPRAPGALRGLNAAVVGLLAAAFYDPVWTSSVRDGADLALAIAAFAALAVFRVPAWLVVLASSAVGAALAMLAR